MLPAPVKPAPIVRAQPPLLRARPVKRARIDPVGKAWGSLNATQKVMLAIHGVILVAVTYHGYKRNRNSVPWAAAWAFGGMVCPTVTAGFALTQGFGQKTGG
jgi:hypothetical protein